MSALVVNIYGLNVHSRLKLSATRIYSSPWEWPALLFTWPPNWKLEPLTWLLFRIWNWSYLQTKPGLSNRIPLEVGAYFIPRHVKLPFLAFEKWNFFSAVSVCTVPWKTISLFYAIFFKSRVRTNPFIPSLLYLTLSLVGKAPPNPIVSARTVQEIFTPALTPTGATSLDLFVANLGTPPGNQWSTALGLRTEDWPQARKKGSAFCMSNFFLPY